MTTRVYLGPSMSLNALFISNGTVFVGDATAEIEQYKKDNPSFSALFVKPEQVAEARRGLQNGDTFLASCYQRVLDDYIKEKGGQ